MSVLRVHAAIQYLSRKPYGVHSPFLYHFASQCVYNDLREEAGFAPIEQRRQALSKSTVQIRFQDYGQGSRFGNGKQGRDSVVRVRKVSQIARRSLQSPKYCRLFYRMARFFKPSAVIETGTSLGITSAYFARAVPEAVIHTIEGCPAISGIANEGFHMLDAGNVIMHTGEFFAVLQRILEEGTVPDMVYFDGNHSQEALGHYYSMISPRLHEGSVVIVDDIRWSKGMWRGWKRLAADPGVTLSLDLGRAGILFYNKNLSKQNIQMGF